MRDLPLPVKIIINIILFIIYWFILNFLSGFLIGIISMFGIFNLDDLSDSLFEKISIIMLFVTGITIFFRTSFYVMKKEINEIKKEKKEIL